MLTSGKEEKRIQGGTDEESFNVSKSKGPTKKINPRQSLNIFNKFKILEEDEEILVCNEDLELPQVIESEAEMKNLDMNLSEYKSKKKSKKLEEKTRSQNAMFSVKKRKMYCISKHKTDNSFQLLEDIEDENIEEIIRKVKLVKTPKRKLKKCRLCNQKRRSCHLDPTKCPARNHNCFSCNKIGHFRKSLCCKKNRRKNMKKMSKRRQEEESSQASSITRKKRKLILQTIRKLEMLQLLEKSLLQNKEVNDEQIKDKDMKETNENLDHGD